MAFYKGFGMCWGRVRDSFNLIAEDLRKLMIFCAAWDTHDSQFLDVREAAWVVWYRPYVGRGLLSVLSTTPFSSLPSNLASWEDIVVPFTGIVILEYNHVNQFAALDR